MVRQHHTGRAMALANRTGNCVDLKNRWSHSEKRLVPLEASVPNALIRTAIHTGRNAGGTSLIHLHPLVRQRYPLLRVVHHAVTIPNILLQQTHYCLLSLYCHTIMSLLMCLSILAVYRQTSLVNGQRTLSDRMAASCDQPMLC